MGGAADREGYGGHLLGSRALQERLNLRSLGGAARETHRLLQGRREPARGPLPASKGSRLREDEGPARDRGARKFCLLRRGRHDLTGYARLFSWSFRTAPDLLLRPR